MNNYCLPYRNICNKLLATGWINNINNGQLNLSYNKYIYSQHKYSISTYNMFKLEKVLSLIQKHCSLDVYSLLAR